MISLVFRIHVTPTFREVPAVLRTGPALDGAFTQRRPIYAALIMSVARSLQTLEKRPLACHTLKLFVVFLRHDLVTFITNADEKIHILVTTSFPMPHLDP
jgi:hypothetical protein